MLNVHIERDGMATLRATWAWPRHGASSGAVATWRREFLQVRKAPWILKKVRKTRDLPRVVRKEVLA